MVAVARPSSCSRFYTTCSCRHPDGEGVMQLRTRRRRRRKKEKKNARKRNDRV